MSEKRTFAADDKFWEVWLDGTQVFTHFGKTGASGQTRIKPTKDADAAAAAMADMIKKKKKEGYTQTGGAKLSSGPQLDDKQVKKHVAALKGPSDPAVLVLADWLQTQQHPWGELIALQYSAAQDKKKGAALDKAATKLLADNGDVILGDLDKRSRVTWHSGFVRSATIGSDADAKAILAAAKSFLAMPIAKLVDEVVFNPIQSSFPVWRDWGTSMRHVLDPWPDLEKLAALVPDRVTKVGFGAWPSEAANAYTRMPAFSKISKAFPKLTKLLLNGSSNEKPGKLSLPALTELEIHFALADGPDLTALGTSKFPKLERLTVGLGAETRALVDEVHPPDEWDEDNEDASRYPETFSAADMNAMDGEGDREVALTAEELEAFLASPWPASLVHLSFASTLFNAEMIGIVLKSKLLKQLKTLDLSNGQLGEDSAKLLIGAKKQLAHLESLDVRRTGIPAANTVKLAAALPNAQISKKDDDYGPDFYFRYIGAME